MDYINICNYRRLFSTSGDEGFTLIEMLLVVTIIGILSSAAVLGVQQHLRNVRIKSTKANMVTIKASLSMYQMEQGRWLDVLGELIVAQDNVGPFLDNDTVPGDGRKSPFRYMVDQGRARLRSAGPDGRFDTADDIFK